MHAQGATVAISGTRREVLDGFAAKLGERRRAAEAVPEVHALRTVVGGWGAVVVPSHPSGADETRPPRGGTVYRTIVVGAHKSDSARAAVDQATQLARTTGASLHLVTRWDGATEPALTRSTTRLMT